MSFVGGALYFAPEKCAKIVTACFCLHNLCKRHNVPLDGIIDDEEDEPLPIVHNEEPVGNVTGVNVRQRLVDNLNQRFFNI